MSAKHGQTSPIQALARQFVGARTNKQQDAAARGLKRMVVELQEELLFRLWKEGCAGEAADQLVNEMIGWRRKDWLDRALNGELDALQSDLRAVAVTNAEDIAAIALKAVQRP